MDPLPPMPPDLDIQVACDSLVNLGADQLGGLEAAAVRSALLDNPQVRATLEQWFLANSIVVQQWVIAVIAGETMP